MRKYIRLVRIYAIAAVLVLALWAGVNAQYVQGLRQAALYRSSLAFEETVHAADSLSRALRKSLYATDGAMCASVCGEAYAAACAAESAMAVLPFSTQELEQLSAFLNQAGDYAYTLCGESREGGFSEQELNTLRDFAVRSAEFIGTLRAAQEELNGGELRMDSREQRLRNVGSEPGLPLSARLLDYEAAFAPPSALSYDGKYSREERPAEGYLTEEEMQQAAAAFLGVAPEELEKVYEYEGLEGRRCFRCGDIFLCVSRSGVESMSQTRLVSEALLSEEEARAAAEDFLKERGYNDLTLRELRTAGAVAAMRFARTEGNAVWLDNDLSIAIALDDGSVHSFNAADFREQKSGVSFSLDEEQAREALPEAFEPESSRQVILTSAGGRDRGCYEFIGSGQGGERVSIYVDAETGEEYRILVE